MSFQCIAFEALDLGILFFASQILRDDNAVKQPEIQLKP